MHTKASLVIFWLLILMFGQVFPSAATTSSEAIPSWLFDEFKPSTLSKSQQQEELLWFKKTAAPFRGMQLYVVSERIDTHKYEADVLAKAFYELTGIRIVHELTGEDDLIRKLQAQVQTGENLYDAYINDSDLIGTHSRSNAIVPLSDFMQEEAQAYTLPTLDLDDFIGLSFTTGMDGKLYQLPDQQFANLYWYRHDWFSRPELQKSFRDIYGYELGVPVNWSAYEDIAEFFSVHVKELDGKPVWGHMDYGKTDPSLGWRMSDAWLGMAGMGDPGLPNGLPVDEWGIRVEQCRPVGASVSRGGALDSPAAIYAVDKYLQWLEQYAPPGAKQLNFTEAGDWVGQGQIAQQIFWYTAFVAATTKPDLPVMNKDGTPKWRIAPSPRGAYWQRGMKSGYQDAGAWTLLKSTPVKRRLAAWLYAQFTVSKTVSLKKTLVGLTPIRQSDIFSSDMAAMTPYLGGLVEFYRSSARYSWSPTGTNVPDYPRLSSLWWRYISQAVERKQTVPETMHALALAMDNELNDIASSSDSPCRPALNEQRSSFYWINQPGAPKPETNEKPPGETLSYEESIKAWN